jgi:hypothetical protein
MERRGELRSWIRPWVHHNRVPNLTQDFGISGTATLKESLKDFSHLGAAPTDWRFVVGLLESPPQDVLVHERQELVEVARLERRPQSVAVHLRIIRPKGLGKADGAGFGQIGFRPALRHPQGSDHLIASRSQEIL